MIKENIKEEVIDFTKEWVENNIKFDPGAETHLSTLYKYYREESITDEIVPDTKRTLSSYISKVYEVPYKARKVNKKGVCFRGLKFKANTKNN